MTIEVKRDELNKILTALAEYGSDRPMPAKAAIASLIGKLASQIEEQEY